MNDHGGVRRRALPGGGSGGYTSQRILIEDQGFCGRRSPSERAPCLAGTLSISSPLGQRAWEGVGGHTKTVRHRRGGFRDCPMNARGAILREITHWYRSNSNSNSNHDARGFLPCSTAAPTSARRASYPRCFPRGCVSVACIRALHHHICDSTRSTSTTARENQFDT